MSKKVNWATIVAGKALIKKLITDEVKALFPEIDAFSHIIEYLYCPRFTYFKSMLLTIPQWTGIIKLIEAERCIAGTKSKEYLRRRIGAVRRRYNESVSYYYIASGWNRWDETWKWNNGTFGL